MRRTTKKKTIAATAFLLFLLILAFLVPHFLGNSADACGRHKPPHHHPRPPPLGKTVVVQFVYQDGTPIGEGLEVELWNSGHIVGTDTTNATGYVTFAGLIDETYHVEYNWQGIHIVSGQALVVTCEKITWEFTEKVAYWTFEKQFYYEYTAKPPSKELDVKLHYPDGSIVTKTTVDGFVSFDDLKAGDYTVEWVWGGETQTEAFNIVFQTESPVEMTNYLEPKSGGGE
jgi:hypothetical protein